MKHLVLRAILKFCTSKKLFKKISTLTRTNYLARLNEKQTGNYIQ